MEMQEGECKMNDTIAAKELVETAGLIFRPTFLQHGEPLQEGEQAKPWKLIETPKSGTGHLLRPEVVGEFETEREAQVERRRQEDKAIRNDPQSWRRSEFHVNYERAASVASELVKIAKELANE
jgi:hypothetical protein